MKYGNGSRFARCQMHVCTLHFVCKATGDHSADSTIAQDSPGSTSTMNRELWTSRILLFPGIFPLLPTSCRQTSHQPSLGMHGICVNLNTLLKGSPLTIQQGIYRAKRVTVTDAAVV
eukprot:854689-Pelagomonas_calceolata.AAC.7